MNLNAQRLLRSFFRTDWWPFGYSLTGYNLTGDDLPRESLTEVGLTMDGLTMDFLTMDCLTGVGLTWDGLTGDNLSGEGLTRDGLIGDGLTPNHPIRITCLRNNKNRTALGLLEEYSRPTQGSLSYTGTYFFYHTAFKQFSWQLLHILRNGTHLGKNDTLSYTSWLLAMTGKKQTNLGSHTCSSTVKKKTSICHLILYTFWQ